MLMCWVGVMCRAGVLWGDKGRCNLAVMDKGRGNWQGWIRVGVIGRDGNGMGNLYKVMGKGRSK